ncbi:UNVERIFIED_CONTAM: Polr2h [Trichonephila clavipes]
MSNSRILQQIIDECKRYSDKFRLVVASTLKENGQPDDGEWNSIQDVGPSRADAFEYVSYGKIYRIEGDDAVQEASRLYTTKYERC